MANTSLNWLHVGLASSNAGLDVLKLENIEPKDLIFSKQGENETAGGQGGVESYRGGWRDDQVRSFGTSCSSFSHRVTFDQLSLSNCRRCHLASAISNTPNFQKYKLNIFLTKKKFINFLPYSLI
jgi:hypothetical protein